MLNELIQHSCELTWYVSSNMICNYIFISMMYISMVYYFLASLAGCLFSPHIALLFFALKVLKGQTVVQHVLVVSLCDYYHHVSLLGTKSVSLNVILPILLLSPASILYQCFWEVCVCSAWGDDMCVLSSASHHRRRPHLWRSLVSQKPALRFATSP